MNKPRLRALQRWIKKNPSHVEMWSWIEGKFADKPGQPTLTGNCGTTACIAGAAVAFWGKRHLVEIKECAGFSDDTDYEEQGAKLLDLSDNEAHRLFIPDYWPDRFLARLEHKTARARAKAVIDRIQFFMDTDGTDIDDSDTVDDYRF